MEIGLNHYLVLSALLFTLGAAGVVIRRNALIILMSIELMLNAVNLTLVAASRFTGVIGGQSVAILVMAVAAAEAAVGLAIIISVFRTGRSVKVDDLNFLRG
jgi:NADH-quinone oxidoreductase subunit K